MFEAKTGVKAKTWANRLTKSQWKYILKKWPEYAYRFTMGQTIPKVEQINPELEKARKNLSTGT